MHFLSLAVLPQCGTEAKRKARQLANPAGGPVHYPGHERGAKIAEVRRASVRKEALLLLEFILVDLALGKPLLQDFQSALPAAQR